MKTAKLVTGILSIVFTCVVLFQSCAAGVVNTLDNTGDVGGSAGLLVGCLMLAGGIVQVATRKSEKRGGSIAAFVLFLIAALLGASNAAVYTDLMIWAGWCAILAILNLVCVIRSGKSKDHSASE